MDNIETVVNGFEMRNPDKLERVVMGNMGRAGVLEGGLTEKVAIKNPELVLAHYDKLAGYITKDGIKIKTGSFWDFKGKAPREVPEVMYIFSVGADKVEVADPKDLAKAIGTLETATAQKEAVIKEKKAKSKFKK